jgi:hypothetical protein
MTLRLSRKIALPLLLGFALAAYAVTDAGFGLDPTLSTLLWSVISLNPAAIAVVLGAGIVMAMRLRDAGRLRWLLLPLAVATAAVGIALAGAFGFATVGGFASSASSGFMLGMLDVGLFTLFPLSALPSLFFCFAPSQEAAGDTAASRTAALRPELALALAGPGTVLATVSMPVGMWSAMRFEIARDGAATEYIETAASSPQELSGLGRGRVRVRVRAHAGTGLSDWSLWQSAFPGQPAAD